MSIQITNLNYTYSPNTPYSCVAINNVNLTINTGDYIGIIGHTGSGKSTLIQHINGLIKLKKGCGSIIVDDIDLTQKKVDYKKLRSRVGMVFQYPEYQLFDDTVYKDVSFGPKNLGLSEQEVHKRVKEAIELVGLNFEDIKDRSPFELSGGQKRRVAIAGVIAMRPSTLILDEPSAGLDPQGKRQILKLIKDLKQNLIPTIIIISHNMDEVFENCSRIIAMADGSVLLDTVPSQMYQHVDLLQSHGLDIANVTKVAIELNKRGLNIKPDVLNREELSEQIYNCLKGGAE